MFWSRRDDSRVEVGAGQFPVVPAVLGLVVLALIVLGVAYAGRTPFGAEIGAPADLESSVNEYLGKNERRLSQRMTYYNCAEFVDSIFSGSQSVAVAVELGAWRPNSNVGPEAAADPGNLLIVAANKEKGGEWQFASKHVPGETYDPSPLTAADPKNPCNLAK